METVAYTMNVPKEGKEVVDAGAAIIKHFRNGGSIFEATILMPAVMKAIDGVGAIKEEFESQSKDELVAYAVHKLWEALQKDPSIAESSDR